MMPNDDQPIRDSNSDPLNITESRAALRFHQIRHLEAAIVKVDTKIVHQKDKLSTLKEERDGLLSQLLAAARDEGDCPLFADLD